MSMLMSHVHVNVHVYMEMGLISLIRYGLRRSEMDTPRHGAGLRHAAHLSPFGAIRSGSGVFGPGSAWDTTENAQALRRADMGGRLGQSPGRRTRSECRRQSARRFQFYYGSRLCSSNSRDPRPN